MNDKNEIKKSLTSIEEERVLEKWNENKTFQKSIEQREGQKEFTFYDGPPFATGLPHYGHLLPGTIKDVIPRYKTMKGFKVERNWGWDTHGLPIENLIEKELNLNSKAEIEEYGIDKFNQAAMDSVLRYDEQWKKIIPRSGRWVDMNNPYKTMDSNYTESLWWAFSELNKKGLVKRDFKPMHICPRCETTLSNNEVTDGYQDLKDLTLTGKFELVDEPGTFVLAWTTTPWTLPGNVALAVGNDIDYVKIVAGEEKYILAKSKTEELTQKSGIENFEILEEFKGSELVGKEYKSLFDYYQNSDLEGMENAYKIYSADFVTIEAGTGIVHIAPAFGGDDLALGRENDLPFIQHVGMNGEFKKEVSDFAGMKVRKLENHSEADIEIIKNLAHRGLLFHKEKIEHSYPTCWRCKTPLLNYATDSWFIEGPKIKDKLLSENAKINWVPKHIGKKRFHNWLDGTRDWAVSRSRYWGAPLPVWKNTEKEEFEFIPSLEELKNKTRSKNNFILIRHGESESNTKGIVSSTRGKNGDKLTLKGKGQVEESIIVIDKILKKETKNRNGEKIDIIISSPFTRTTETANILKDKLDFQGDIIFDERIRERSFVDYDGKKYDSYYSDRSEEGVHGRDDFDAKTENGESKRETRNRMMEFFYEIDKKYEGKNILVVTHFDPLFLAFSGLKGLNGEEVKTYRDEWGKVSNAKPIYFDFAPIPHNKDYILDYHRPYIDKISWKNEEGEKFEHIKEVFDCWFESGSMPFASKHYPFDKSKFNPEKGIGFPADFIAEGQDQTRGWFNTMLVLSTALFGESSYKNVVVNGVVLAEDGKKMSKSLNNYPPVTEYLDKYGADALRLVLMSSPAVRGESLSLSEKSLSEVVNKVIMKVKNIISFYELQSEYFNENINPRKSKNILDKWIILKISELHKTVTDNLESYELDKASRGFMDFMEEFSAWYIRRSRDRFKSDDKEDKEYSVATINFVLRELAKMMAPFTPFLSEIIWEKIHREGDKESIHLENWTVMEGGLISKAISSFDSLSEDMNILRDMVTLGLEARVSTGFKVRQPLKKIIFIGDRFKNIFKEEQFKNILLEELNIKEIEFEKGENEKVELDTELNDELILEGNYREFLRLVQSMRKNAGLKVEDIIELKIDIDESKKDFIQENLEDLEKTAGVKNINYSGIDGEEDNKKVNSIEFKMVLIK